MKRNRKIGLALLFSLLMMVTLIPQTSFALDSTDFELVGESVTKSSEAQDVTISFLSVNGVNLEAIQGTLSTADSTGNVTLKSITSSSITLTGMNYADHSTGAVMWGEDTWTGVNFSAGESIITATYSVAGNTPAGNYNVGFTD
ncbi:MAG: hypothetical protein IJU75_05765, partial [Clostridia bacterium]|nr:hypothetical protein [Clostridia bacterium]